MKFYMIVLIALIMTATVIALHEHLENQTCCGPQIITLAGEGGA